MLFFKSFKNFQFFFFTDYPDYSQNNYDEAEYDENMVKYEKDEDDGGQRNMAIDREPNGRSNYEYEEDY